MTKTVGAHRSLGRSSLIVVLSLALLGLWAPPADAVARQYEWISQPGTGTGGTPDERFEAATADGARVFFSTLASLTADDTDAGYYDIYMRSGGATTLVSPGIGAGGTDGNVTFAGMNSDGTKIWFETLQRLAAGDADGGFDLYEYSSGTVSLVSAAEAGGTHSPPSSDDLFCGASADGSKVYFNTALDLTPGSGDAIVEDGVDYFMREGGTTTLISAVTGTRDAPLSSTNCGTSPDGTSLFITTGQQLHADDTCTSPDADVYEWDGASISMRTPGSGDACNHSGIYKGSSTTGSTILFESNSNYVTGDNVESSGNGNDAYTENGGTFTWMTPPGTGASSTSCSNVQTRGATADLSALLFETTCPRTVDDSGGDVDLFLRQGGETYLVTQVDGGSGANADPFPRAAHLSADGTRVTFTSGENLTSNDGDSVRDLYQFNVSGTATTLLSAPGAGAAGSPVAVLDPGVTALLGVVGPDSCLNQVPRVCNPHGGNSDGTRILFTTPEQLLGADTDTAVNDIYEWNSPSSLELATPSPEASTLGARFAQAGTTDAQTIYFDGDGFCESDTTVSYDVFKASPGTPPSSCPGVAPGPGPGTGPGTGGLAISVSGAKAKEGKALKFDVTLSAAATQQVAVAFATTPGSAKGGKDFKAASGNLTFAPGDTAEQIVVKTKNDKKDEKNEKLTIALSGPTGATLGIDKATGKIKDNDR